MDQYAYNGAYDQGDASCMRIRPIYDRHGKFLGRREVNMCS